MTEGNYNFFATLVGYENVEMSNVAIKNGKATVIVIRMKKIV
jgi:hypothetical protein